MGEILMPFLIDGQVEKNAYIVITNKVSWINVNKQSMVVQNHGVTHCIYFIACIKPWSIFQILPWQSIFGSQWTFHWNPRRLNNSLNWLPKPTLLCDDDYWISSTRAWLMHNGMHITSSHINNWAQFHTKAT